MWECENAHVSCTWGVVSDTLPISLCDIWSNSYFMRVSKLWHFDTPWDDYIILSDKHSTVGWALHADTSPSLPLQHRLFQAGNREVGSRVKHWKDAKDGRRRRGKLRRMMMKLLKCSTTLSHSRPRCDFKVSTTCRKIKDIECCLLTVIPIPGRA